MPKRDTKTNTGCPPKLNKRIWNMSIKNQIVDIVVQKKKTFSESEIFAEKYAIAQVSWGAGRAESTTATATRTNCQKSMQ